MTDYFNGLPLREPHGAVLHPLDQPEMLVYNVWLLVINCDDVFLELSPATGSSKEDLMSFYYKSDPKAKINLRDPKTYPTKMKVHTVTLFEGQCDLFQITYELGKESDVAGTDSQLRINEGGDSKPGILWHNGTLHKPLG